MASVRRSIDATPGRLASGASGGTGPGAAGAAPSVDQHIVILSGLSGAGKTAATKLFEDLGYTCVDNLPGELLPDLAELVSEDRQRFERVAIVLDVRAGDASLALAAVRGALEGRGIRPQVIFLEARDEVLIRRFSETRHRHPLADQRGIASSIAEERRVLDPVREEADVVVDTSDLSLRELRERIFAHLGENEATDRLVIQLISFGFKYGIPLEADLVFDVRFMQNPYYIEELRQLSGLTEAVRNYVLGQPVTKKFLEFLHEFLVFTIPAYVAEGKTRLAIGIGCTGGYHRSIAIAEALAGWLREEDLGSSRSSTASSTGHDRPPPPHGDRRPAALARIGHRDQALAGRRIRRRARPRPRRGLRPPPALPRRGDHGPLQSVVYLVTLQFLPYIVRALILAVLGVGVFAFASYRVLQVLMGPYRSDDDGQPLVELIYQKRFLARGPKIAALGGGHGLSTLLRGLKEHTSNLTAIVTVADDGGSSGKLRDQLGVPAVGDIRNCLVALADAEPLMSELFQYRFPGEEAAGRAWPATPSATS